MGQQYSRHGFRRATGAVALAASVTLLAACGGGSSSDSTGTASFSVTDAPVDNVNRVQITFDRIDLNPAEGQIQTIELEEPRTIENLLELQGNNSEQILGDTTLPAGQYNWIRLFVIGGNPDSVVDETGGAAGVDLFVPGQQPNANRTTRFVQLSSPFRVPAGGSADFTIDIQLRKALTKPENKEYYLLRPSLRLIDNSESGTLVGDVDPNFEFSSGTSVSDEGCGGPSVYVYGAGDGDFTAEDIGSENEPLTTADLKAPTTGADSSNYTYEVGFLAADDYRVAVACADGDDPEVAGDEIPISAGKGVTVTAGDDPTVLDFGL